MMVIAKVIAAVVLLAIWAGVTLYISSFIYFWPVSNPAVPGVVQFAVFMIVLMASITSYAFSINWLFLRK